jgi:hypothetical protein
MFIQISSYTLVIVGFFYVIVAIGGGRSRVKASREAQENATSAA